MTTGAAPTPQRRTQAQRSAATREALLEATIECLVEDGYAGTTTSRVALRAGVSRGAHLHHFQTRNALIAAALQQLAVRRHAEALAAADRLPAGPERLPAALDIIWSFYASQLFQAALDLWSHARTDPELRAPGATGEVQLDQVKLGSHSAHFSFAQHHGKLVQHAIDKFVAVDAAINLG